MTFLLRRILRAVLLLAGVSALCFLFMEMAPGSFFDEMRLNPQVSPETIASLRTRYGLDQPVVVRYGLWVRSAIHGDFGQSIAYNVPVGPLVWSRAKNTLLLTTIATLLTWMVSVPLGLWIATRRERALDKVIHLGTSLFISLPEVVIAVALLAVVVRWRIIPLGGMHALDSEGLPSWARWTDFASHMVLPVIILVLVESAIIVRHVRAAMAEALSMPFVNAARGLGIGRLRLLFRHVLPAAASPLISLFGFSLAGLISGSLLVEVVCGWPGLGPMILEATFSRDLYIVIAAIMLSALFMVGGNLVADLLLWVCDPRIRTGVPDAP